MTDRQRHDEQERLARLYREQGDIEPGPGVDLRIRARARADTRLSGAPRPAHWLGGVAVAASLFVVVSIVTNLQPPEAELPASGSTRTNAEGSAPDAGAPEMRSTESGDFARQTLGDVEQRAARQVPERQSELEGIAEQARPEALAEQAEPDAFEERSGPDASASASDTMLKRRTRWSAADNAAETAREQYESLGSSRQSEKDRAEARELLQSTDSAELEMFGEDVARSQRALWLIDRLISVGNAERARVEAERFRDEHPGQKIPKRLLDRLEKLEAEDDGGD